MVHRPFSNTADCNGISPLNTRCRVVVHRPFSNTADCNPRNSGGWLSSLYGASTVLQHRRLQPRICSKFVWRPSPRPAISPPGARLHSVEVRKTTGLRDINGVCGRYRPRMALIRITQPRGFLSKGLLADGTLLGGKVQLARDLYATHDGPGDRTALGVHVDHALYGLAILLLGSEVEGLLDPLYHEYLVFRLYLPDRVGVETVLIEGNLTRCQRACEGAQQSATSRRDQVIEGGRVLLLVVGRDTVMLGDLTVNPKEHRLFFTRNIRSTGLPLYRLHLHSRDVGYISHPCLSLPQRIR